MTGTASYTASRDEGWRDRRGRWRCRDRRAKLPARAWRSGPPRLRGLARMRWLSVCPSGTSRAPAEIQFDTTACRKACMVGATGIGMRRADEADGDGIDDRAAASGDHPVESVARPRLSRAISMKARPCVVVSSWRSREGTKAAASSAISRNRGLILRGCGAMRLRQKHGVAKAGAVAEHRGQPVAQRCGVRDVARLHRPFDAAGIGERADRKGRRQPGHQPVQRRRLIRIHSAARVGGRGLTCGHEHGSDRGGDDRGRNVRRGDGAHYGGDRDHRGGRDDHDRDHARNGHGLRHGHARNVHVHARGLPAHGRDCSRTPPLRDRTALRSR